MSEIVANPLFGLTLCILGYRAAQWISAKLRSPLANPLLIADILIACFLLATGISYDDFNRGGAFLALFLTPATTALGVSIYRQREVLRRSLLPVGLGCLAGCATSLASIAIFGRMLGLSDVMLASLLPKSVTTAIALDLSETAGGIPAITMVAVIIAGISGSVMAPFMIRLFRVKNPVAQGVGLGTSSHAVGTARALELGEVQGAMGGIAIGLSGLFTVLLYLLM